MNKKLLHHRMLEKADKDAGVTVVRAVSAQTKLDRLYTNLMAAERKVDYWRQRIVNFSQTDRPTFKRQKQCRKCGVLYTPMHPDEKCPSCRGIA